MPTFLVCDSIFLRALQIGFLDDFGMKAYCFGMKANVSERGQITLPKIIRADLGIRAGTVLELSVVDGKIIGYKREEQDQVHKWKGHGNIPGRMASVDDYLREARE